MPKTTTRRHPHLEPFGDRVRQRRQELGLSQEALGQRAGLHPTYIGGIERGERNLSLHNILKVARALEIDAGELMRGLTP
ncbi:MAG TPA: helix-turn-helix transcriptional regulator [Acidimicrobiia bacterium]|nr:helix-turn-helix transcriptional regulator [Acidimicrobiia bacterium]